MIRAAYEFHERDQDCVQWPPDTHAIEIVEQALKKHEAPVYVRHEIVHNLHVVEDLRTRGAVFVDELDVPFVGCGAGQPCPANTVCNGMFCIPKPNCMVSTDCPSGNRCEYGYCQPFVCQTDRDCDFNWSCVAGTCYPPLYCGDTSNCPMPLMCVTHQCLNPGGCVTSSECATFRMNIRIFI